MQIKIVRFEKHPKENPTDIAVGFDITFDNDRVLYVDTTVDLDLSEEIAVEAAWSKVEQYVEQERKTTGSLPKIIGSVFIPAQKQEEVITEDNIIEEEIITEEVITEEIIEEDDIIEEEEVIEEEVVTEEEEK